MHLFSSPVWDSILQRLVLAVLAAGLGSFVAISFKKISHLTLCVLISFAAGALLAVCLFDLIPETYEMLGLVPTLLSFVSGYLLFYLVTKFLFHICPACAATHTEMNFSAVTWTMVTALSIHSFMDGLAIYSGHLSGSMVGTAVLAAVVFHKFPEGLALSLVARSSGMSRPKTFFLSTFLEASTTLAGGIIGLAFLLPGDTKWIGFVLGHVGGGFVFLVLHALLSEAIRHHPKSTIFACILGAVLVGIVSHIL